MSETYVQVNVPATAGKKLKTFESVDGNSDVVQSEAVTLCDSAGAEVVPATEATVAKRFGVAVGSPVTATAAGDTTVYTPTPGARVRLKWLGLSSPSGNSASVLATVRIGTTEIYRWSMGAPGAFSHSSVREGGVDEELVINLDDDQTVHVNIDVEEF